MGDERIPDEVLATYTESLDRCVANPRFLDLFYERFLSSSDKVAERFEDTRFDRQKRVLRHSLYTMTRAAQGNPDAQAEMEEIARRHSRRQLNIEPALYDLWLESLLQTVRDVDTKHDAHVESAWRTMLGREVEHMKSLYED